MTLPPSNPHRDQGIEIYGAPLHQAKLAVIILHGRRQSAIEAYKNGEAIGLPDIAYILPSAKDKTWYPHGFMAPIDHNQPQLDDALDCVSATIAELHGFGFDYQQIVLMGFSQGACLATEYLNRHPLNLGGLIAFSGGLFGPADTPLPKMAHPLSCPVFFGTSDNDSWIPLARIEETAKTFSEAGAQVDFRIYPDMPHQVCQDQIDAARQLLQCLLIPQPSYR